MKLLSYFSLLFTIPFIFSLATATPNPNPFPGKGANALPGKEASGSRKGSRSDPPTSPPKSSDPATSPLQLRCVLQLLTVQCIEEAACGCEGMPAGRKPNCRWQTALIYPRCEQVCRCIGRASIHFRRQGRRDSNASRDRGSRSMVTNDFSTHAQILKSKNTKRHCRCCALLGLGMGQGGLRAWD